MAADLPGSRTRTAVADHLVHFHSAGFKDAADGSTVPDHRAGGLTGIGHCFAFLAPVKQTKVQPGVSTAERIKQKRLSTAVEQAFAGVCGS